MLSLAFEKDIFTPWLEASIETAYSETVVALVKMLTWFCDSEKNTPEFLALQAAWESHDVDTILERVMSEQAHKKDINYQDKAKKQRWDRAELDSMKNYFKLMIQTSTTNASLSSAEALATSDLELSINNADTQSELMRIIQAFTTKYSQPQSLRQRVFGNHLDKLCKVLAQTSNSYVSQQPNHDNDNNVDSDFIDVKAKPLTKLSSK